MDKHILYREAIQQIDSLLEGETLAVTKMASINSVLKQQIPYIYWIGFYLVHRDALIVGPYMGTPGCIHIDFSRGVCGKAARTRKPQIVPDVHALEQGTEHIACDPVSRSEIVVPVFNGEKQLMAVYDLDSDRIGAFDDTDCHYLEHILERHFAQSPAETGWDYHALAKAVTE